MGKSYKKTPVVKDNNRSKKQQKKTASRKVRRMLKEKEDLITGGCSYKKLSESYDIADYVCRWTEQEAIEHYNKMMSDVNDGLHDDTYKKIFFEEFPTLESYLIHWKKQMIRK